MYILGAKMYILGANMDI